jgi:hypothetical protein
MIDEYIISTNISSSTSDHSPTGSDYPEQSGTGEPSSQKPVDNNLPILTIGKTTPDIFDKYFERFFATRHTAGAIIFLYLACLIIFLLCSEIKSPYSLGYPLGYGTLSSIIYLCSSKLQRLQDWINKKPVNPAKNH